MPQLWSILHLAALSKSCSAIWTREGRSVTSNRGSEPYYDDGTVTIYHGDCREILPTLPAVDLFVTSPPYNLGTTTGGGFARTPGTKTGTWSGGALAYGYESFSDSLPMDEYENDQGRVLELCWKQLTPSGAIFYNHKPRVQGGVSWLPFMADLPLRQIVVWDRGAGMNFAPTHFVPRYEWVLLYAKPEFRLTDGASGLSDVWRFPPERGVEDHPAPFPLGLPTRCVESTAAQLICDPYMGSGTTLRAAKDLGRRAIGIEIEERYCEMAAKRVAQESLFSEVA